ncbi:hypothetical protein HS088_TW21G00065 [Tripterygium wilfordii]|uniref:Uncharacterized protein n=1 Tax=Tripterygium wilfordii TaxID=458696 RepID=A0A7J7C1X7_TRIWF|nr:uncharacterized protein LOC119988745 [Tripterygium wilfordii]KAF5727925.1 hypothetical protein HS088_TW21G00065 [Tripterygium wilfordii]
MTLLEVIKKASATHEPREFQSDYPFILNPDDVFPKLKPKHENPDRTALAYPITGWQLQQADSQLIDSTKKFHKKLRRKIKGTNSFDGDEFIQMLNQFLAKTSQSIGISVGVNSSDNGYPRVLLEKVGFLMGQDVSGLVLEACVNFEVWDLVETLIVNGLIEKSYYSNLITSLAAKKRSDLLCLCIKHALDLGSSELLCILKYFLSPLKDAYGTLMCAKKEWESQALLAIERVNDINISGKKLRIAKNASILLMIAHDDFSVPELCLHYLLASSNVDEVILVSSLGKLNGQEMMNLIRYLGKWLKKFERFPQAIPCPKASSLLGLKACDWVPKMEDVVRWLGLVLDENFSSLVLHPEFHEELKSMERVVQSLALEAKVCCSLGNVIDSLRFEAEGEQN